MAPKSLPCSTCGSAQPAAPAVPMIGPADEPLTYSLAEAGRRIGGIPERWLAERLRNGEISGYKIGRKWRMTEVDIQACIAQFRVTARAEPAADKVASAEPTPPNRQVKTRKISPKDQMSLFT